jgi:hypothetical protein
MSPRKFSSFAIPRQFVLRSALAAVLLGSFGLIPCAPVVVAGAQTNISGDIVGSVTDPQGAAIPNATVTVSSKGTGTAKTVTTGGRGDYRVPLLSPGDYEITVSAAGFEGAKSNISVAAGSVASGDIKLTVGKATTTVDVTTSQPLLHTEDAQMSTSFTMEQVQALPNPGNDLTFVAQTSPGAVMNTEMGYGNFSVFGLPATSNTFTVNGGYENDPFLNVNNSGATNLLLGNNDIADVTVTSNAYDAAFGGLGGAQVSEISRSGGNGFHGNASYWWNGRIMNANSYFNNQTPDLTPRPFDNVNQWAAGVGGPIKKDKAFWFVDYEGLRVILPTTNIVTAPSQQYINEVTGVTPFVVNSTVPGALPCGNLVTGFIPYGVDGNTNKICAPPTKTTPGYVYPTGSQSAQIPLYNSIFSVYQHPANYASGTANSNDPYAVNFPVQNSNFTHEWLITGRIDVNLGANDKLFGHSNVDKGLQATYTDAFNPLFDADSPQPQYQGQLSETHTFSPTLTNQFLFSLIYYRAIFTNTNLGAADALIPFSLNSASLVGGSTAFDGNYGTYLNQTDQFSAIGGLNYLWPQGRTVTGYTFQDDLSRTMGNHTVKVGWTMRRDDVTDYGPSILSTPLVASNEAVGFATGNLDGYYQQFPTRLTQPIALYTMGAYLQDTWKALPNLTVTAGLRLEHNSNPVCLTSCYNVLTNDFFGSNVPVNTPFNQIITSDKKRAFNDLQTVGYEPRMGFSWQPLGVGSHTVIRGGFGMFADAFPAQITDSLLNNAPGNAAFFVGGFTDPTVAGSAASNAAAASASFQAGFANGSANAAAIGPVGFYNAAQHIYYPTYEEYNLAVEQQLNRNTAISVSYVGNHGYHEPVQDGAINTGNQYGSYANFALPLQNPVQSLGRTTEVYSGASSSYNGLITSITHHERYVTLQFNYAYSHSLDEISNGGFNSFGGDSLTGPSNPFNLADNYGNADYDTRNYISGSYVVSIPYYGGPHVLTDSWTIAGTAFHTTGYPLTVLDGNASTALNNNSGGNYSSNTFAARLNGVSIHCGASNVYDSVTSNVPNPCPITAASGNFAEATAFGQQARNQVRGPNYTDTDLDVSKGFKLPKWEAAQLKIGAQFFNLFNHPNFAQPTADVSNLADNGGIFGTVNPPTSILGSFLGGNASPRLIQFKGTFVF